jgi:hypothetical protein
LARDENLRRIRQVGRAKWKRESGDHRRSLAETAVFRLKTIFGGKLVTTGESWEYRSMRPIAENN